MYANGIFAVGEPKIVALAPMPFPNGELRGPFSLPLCDLASRLDHPGPASNDRRPPGEAGFEPSCSGLTRRLTGPAVSRPTPVIRRRRHESPNPGAKGCRRAHVFR